MSVRPILARTAKSAFAVSELLATANPGPRILIYHQVGTDIGREMEVPTSTFLRQLDWMESHGSFLSLEHALQRRGEDESSGIFSLTFDDGYADLFYTVYPFLKAESIPFTLYLTTEPVETGIPITKGGQANPLTWAQVNEMLSSDLLTIGAHTHRHPDMRGLSVSIIQEELETSNHLIEARTGVRPLDFAYPKGYWDSIADQEVRRRYHSAVLGAGPPVTSASDPHQLHRIPVQRSDGFYFFKRKMVTGLRWEEKVRRKVRGYQGP